MTDCDSCVVRNRAICSALSSEELAMLGRLGRRQTVSRGQTLVWEGDEALVVANVIRGVLKLSVSMADGREQIVGVVFPSDFIGRPFGKESPYSVTAMTDAEVCIFTRAAFDGFAKSHPDLGHRLLQRTLDELDRARQWMMVLGRARVRHRRVVVDRQQMGDVLGLTIETVSRQLTKLKQADAIELPDRRTVVIKDRRRLADAAMAGED